MEFSSISYCAENKRVNFSSFKLGTFFHQSANMGVHHSKEIPFVELTGHKLEETLVHPFEISGFSRGLGFAGKIHNFTTNAKQFVRNDSFLARKDLYGHQFPALAFSQLVGGFVGSKSQIGSSGKEFFKIWDLVFDKLAEFCGSHDHPENCNNLNKSFPREVFHSFCQKSVPSEFIIEKPSNIANKAPQTISNPTQDVPDCAPSLSDISKQSYADVARNYAIAQESKKRSVQSPSSKKQSVQSPSLGIPRAIIPKRRNQPHRGNLVRCQMNRPFENIRQVQYNRPFREFRNQTRFFASPKRRPDCNRNYPSTVNLEQERKTEKPREETGTTNSHRVELKTEEKMATVQTAPKESALEAEEVCSESKESCEGSDVQQLSVCSVSEESSDDDDSQSSDDGAAQLLSPKRTRFLSECSSDSEDSFIVFKSEADSDAGVKTSSALNFDDVCVFEFSDDEDTDSDSDEDTDSGSEEESDDDGDECNDHEEKCSDNNTLTVAKLSLFQVNERWRKENSAYPTSEKVSSKVQFADDDALETIHAAVEWDRTCPWLQCVVDRKRFHDRIERTEKVLAPILTSEHRLRIWKERMTTTAT